MDVLRDDRSVIERVFDHIDNETTDVSETTWREPVEHYRSPDRFAAELALVLRRVPIAFCPSAALPETGSFVARAAAGVPIFAVRGNSSLNCTPGKLVGIAPNSPRTSAGPLGFGSNVSCCGFLPLARIVPFGVTVNVVPDSDFMAAAWSGFQ